MDVKKFGAFIAEMRKEKGMTQADLAAKLNVTDKAASRWERGLGFPDISTLTPLADALGVSILELMRSERMTTGELTREEATGILANTLEAAQQQRHRRQPSTIQLLGLSAGIIILSVACIFYLAAHTNFTMGVGIVVQFLASSPLVQIAELLLGLSAWAFSVAGIIRSGKGSEKKGFHYSAVSWCLCSAALWIVILSTDLSVRLGDLTTVMDCALAYNMASFTLLFITALLNLASYLIRRRK